MKRALVLARRGLGKTSPNPAVGAVVAHKGRIVAEGYHRKAGGPHAEVIALARAGRRAWGATLYVTLEPCSTWGKTPPCTDAILLAGIRRVVVAARDPNPHHDGHGLTILRRAGIKVEQGLLAEEAARMNVAFNKWIINQVPLVIAKVASSLDGRIATRTGDSKWITNESARREVHRVRSQVDAVMVSAGTVRADDPSLTVRHGVRGRQPWRVVVDGRGRTPLGAKLFTDEFRGRTLVLTTRASARKWREALQQQGVTVEVARADGQHVDLKAALKVLGKRSITSVMVEGGGDMLVAMIGE
jgi:diaminohydroxyphosphoribosylaminopyrimidine deaminase/5-amino-6-(5-phosphoribosylamino)uracil reductase